jgi:hypothetical protein
MKVSTMLVWFEPSIPARDMHGVSPQSDQNINLKIYTRDFLFFVLWLPDHHNSQLLCRALLVYETLSIVPVGELKQE